MANKLNLIFTMEKYLKVIKPFSLLDEDHEFTTDDVFEKNADGNYECTTTNENNLEDTDISISKSEEITYEIGVECVKDLIDLGYLSDKNEDKKVDNGSYVNIFDEIDKLRDSYTNNLKTIDDRHKDDPACLKTEDEAVTTNLIKLLDYLKSLKK